MCAPPAHQPVQAQPVGGGRSPVQWLPLPSWADIVNMSNEVPELSSLATDIEGSPGRFREVGVGAVMAVLYMHSPQSLPIAIPPRPSVLFALSPFAPPRAHTCTRVLLKCLTPRPPPLLPPHPPTYLQWFGSLLPERERLPLEWRDLEKKPFLKLCVVKALRPDRITSALTAFVEQVLPGAPAYTKCDANLSSYQVCVGSGGGG
jgi:hypothetical protein